MFNQHKIILEKEVAHQLKPNVPNLVKDYADAQMILKQCSAGSGDCLYVIFLSYVERYKN